MENKGLLRLIRRLSGDFSKIDEKRKKLLGLTADLISDQIREKGVAKLNFICTHNSRRSQLAEAWTVAAAQYFNIHKLKVYSGGTEATSFNIRMVVALREASFHLHSDGPIENPRYKLLALRDSKEEHIMFSKIYDDSFNPASDFFALMVCDDADANCPLVYGALHRISLTFEDPKAFDDTPMESMEYGNKVEEIGREIIYLVSEIKL